MTISIMHLGAMLGQKISKSTTATSCAILEIATVDGSSFRLKFRKMAPASAELYKVRRHKDNKATA